MDFYFKWTIWLYTFHLIFICMSKYFLFSFFVFFWPTILKQWKVRKYLNILLFIFKLFTKINYFFSLLNGTFKHNTSEPIGNFSYWLSLKEFKFLCWSCWSLVFMSLSNFLKTSFRSKFTKNCVKYSNFNYTINIFNWKTLSSR